MLSWDTDRFHDDVIKWKHFPRYWPFVREIHRSPVNFPHKGQWRGALMFSLNCARMNGWVNSREAGDLRRYRVHYDVIVMFNSIPCGHFTVTTAITAIGAIIWCFVPAQQRWKLSTNQRQKWKPNKLGREYILWSTLCNTQWPPPNWSHIMIFVVPLYGKWKRGQSQ